MSSPDTQGCWENSLVFLTQAQLSLGTQDIGHCVLEMEARAPVLFKEHLPQSHTPAPASAFSKISGGGGIVCGHYEGWSGE